MAVVPRPAVRLKRFGSYLLESRISSGGMADVYRARLIGIRGFAKSVAIKRIHPHLLERQRFLRMFVDEAKIASRLVHRNIVQIHELGEEAGVPFIAMEYVPGRDLHLVMQRLVSLRQRVPVSFATRVVTELCNALQYAHELQHTDGLPQEIVHRDVSPRNILVSFGGEVKLTDFGVARARDREEHTEHGFIKGKVRYISPEAAAGEVVDHRSDVYSLAVVLTEMLTMRPFREGASDVAILLAIRDGRVDPERLAGVPPPLCPLLENALEADPDRRCPSAAALRDQLSRCATGGLQPMSTEEAAALMQGLFREEIEREQEHGRLVERAVFDWQCSGGELRPTSERTQAPPPLYEPPPQLEGELTQTSLTRLLHRMATEEAGGRLDLKREPMLKSLYFEDGEPVFVVSNVESELFGEHLVAHGLISRDEHARALELASSGGSSFIEALLQMGSAPPHELYRQLATQVRDRILDLFTWTRGRFAFFPEATPPESGMPLGLRCHVLVHEGVFEHVPMVVVRRALEGQRSGRILLTGTPLPRNLQLSGREQRVLRSLESEEWTLNDFLRREHDEEQVLRLVYLLREIDHLRLV